MIGTLELSETIVCQNDVMGKGYDIDIKGIKAQVLFPRIPPMDIDEKLPNTGIHNPLLSPAANRVWKKGSEHVKWGYPINYPRCDCSVYCLEVIVECEDKHAIEMANVMCENIQLWEHAFIDYLRIVTKQHTERDANNHRDKCQLQLVYKDENFVNDQDPIFLYVIDPSQCASKDNILKAIEFANSGKDLFLEYQMLLSAYNERRLCKNRQSILDACASIELCLVRYITEQCNIHGFDADWFLDNKFRSLGDRIKLAGSFDHTFPADEYLNNVSSLRNKVMHNKSIFPSDKETNALILHVENALNHFLKGEYY